MLGKKIIYLCLGILPDIFFCLNSQDVPFVLKGFQLSWKSLIGCGSFIHFPGFSVSLLTLAVDLSSNKFSHLMVEIEVITVDKLFQLLHFLFLLQPRIKTVKLLKTVLV